MFDPITLLAALAPVAVEAGKAAISRFIAPDTFRPSTIEQWLQMQEMQLKLFTAINTAGMNVSGSYPWVAACIQLMRPFVAAVVSVVWGASYAFEFSDPNIDNAAATIWFYLFGDRTLFYGKQLLTPAK